MADISIIEATGGVADPKAGETGKPQGEKPGLPPLYQQLPKAEIARLEGLAKDGKLDYAKLPAKFDTLWGEFQKLQSELGNAVRVPGKDATKEEREAYRKAVGIPAAPEGYTFSRPQLPNGLAYSEKLEKWFRQELFDAGVADTAAQKMFNDWNALQSESYTAAVAARAKADEDSRSAAAKAAVEALKAEYKDEYPRMMQLRDAAIARFGGPDIIQAFKDARLPNGLTMDNDPRVSKLLVEVGKRMDVDTMVSGAGGSGAGESAPRPGIPKSPSGLPMNFYPDMEKSEKFRVKAE